MKSTSKIITAKDFLEMKGIELNKCAFLCVIDDYMRQPNICMLLDEYHSIKLSELENNIKESVELVSGLSSIVEPKEI